MTKMRFLLVCAILTVASGCKPPYYLPHGFPFGEQFEDECLDGAMNGRCQDLNDSDVFERADLSVNYTFYGQKYRHVFVCSDGLLSFGDSDDVCEYPKYLNTSEDPLIVGFWGEDIKLNLSRSGRPFASYKERTRDGNGCFNESKKIVMDYLKKGFGLNDNVTHIFVSTWDGIHDGEGTVQIVLATIEGINETYALLISNNTNFAEEDREQIGFSAGHSQKYFPLSCIMLAAEERKVDVSGVYVFRIDKDDIDHPDLVTIMIEGNGTSGFIKVKKNNEWGSVCDDYWTDEDANVACGQLGFLPYGASAIRRGSFINGEDIKYFMDDVMCSGHEKCIFSCPHQPQHNCRRRERAGVHCLRKEDVEIRLSNGAHGVINLRIKNTWGFVCHNHWGNKDAEVVCRQLGHSHSGTMATHEQKEGEEYLAMLDHVRCEGDEENLLACRYISKMGNSGDCTKVAGVICG